MKTKLIAAAAMACLAFAPGGISERITEPAYADRDQFCAGFEEGFRTIAGSMAILPICPIPPITPIGSTPYREGIKKGIAEGCRRYPNKC